MSKWRRFLYLPVNPMGEDGRIVTGCKAHIALSRRAAGEGMVLLKNEESVLPVARGTTVALFGIGSTDYVKGGGGSGDVNVAYTRNLCDAMEEKQAEGKVSVVAPLCDFYRTNLQQQRADGVGVGRTTEPELPLNLLEDAARIADVAIISICRYSQENRDRVAQPHDGDFYLSEMEEKLVNDVCSRFDHVVVVLNVGGMVDTSWFKDNPKIQSVLLAWQGGMEGACAEADILCGDVNPSGKLVDSFAGSFDDYPSSYNFNESDDYVCYTDDIFVGYRYFETIPGAAEKVNYPFGFGLSYTTFEIACDSAREADGNIHLLVRVKNTGSFPGREVVQVYSSAPECRIDMAKRELRAFTKTRLLSPGEEEVLELSFAVSDMTAYDEQLAAYVQPCGDYTIWVGNSVRSVQQVYTYHAAQEQLVKQLKNRCVPSKLPCRMKADGTYVTLPVTQYAPEPDRSEWPAVVRWDMQHILPNTYGIKLTEPRLTMQMVLDGEATLDAFVDSLTDDELITLVGGAPNRGLASTCGIGGLDQLGIPAVMTADGPAGLRISRTRGVCTTAWPVATHLACTWDTELLYQIGEAGAKEVKENNLGMWLTPGINIHRTPLCGRNFEYYSEDPLLAGKMASALVRGIQSQNISACVKHFCVNNKETNRKFSDSVVSERALREIYLRAFEIVVKEGAVWSVMTAYNLLNGKYTSANDELLTGILRDEWGYEGLVITDWDNYAEPYQELLAGNDVRMPNGSPKRLQKAMSEGLLTREDLKKNVRRILELLLRFD